MQEEWPVSMSATVSSMFSQSLCLKLRWGWGGEESWHLSLSCYLQSHEQACTPPHTHTRVRWEEKGGFSKHTLATLGVTNFSTFDLYVLTDETAAFTLS